MTQSRLINDMRKLKKLLASLGFNDLYQKMAGSKSKTELQDNLSYTLKSLQDELAKIEPVPVQIGRSLMRGRKGGLHPDFSGEGQHNERPFNWDNFGKAMVNRLFGKGKA